ncbi:MAG: hypothetical protein ACFCD0_02675 [Gemmataceae bacterium]
MDFDPGPDSFVRSADSGGIYVAKYAPNGDLIDAQIVGGTHEPLCCVIEHLWQRTVYWIHG